ncbi:polysaccharide biosynthesis protein [Bergeyella sp. RCAD1439]|uniref:polysaccharide biosynthesis protein n=1 Tax=Bergeyella anatis TaxID=3113737 RepID=UPI002E17DD0A|nr:nucleoside-diphosphate sugar epimerase/dehydratase [Bergeyella sp. RCAD1439]
MAKFSFEKLRQKIYGGDNLVNLSDVRYLPRWVILFLDVFLLGVSLFIAFYTVMKLGVDVTTSLPILQKSLLIVTVNVGFMFLFRTYAGIIRHSTFIDLFKLLLASFCTVMLLVMTNFLFERVWERMLFHNSVLVIYFALSFMFLFLFRLLVKEVFHMAREIRRSTLRKRILVMGVSEQSVAMGRAILDNPHLPYQVVGFLTSGADPGRLRILGKSVFTKKKIEKFSKEDLGIDGVLLIKEVLSREEMNQWVGLFLEKELQVFKAPSVQKLRDKDLEASAIKTLQIEDLLNRKPIKIENEEVRKRHEGKAVLVTGGAGSIGSEIVRQVAQFEPSLVVVLDQAETPLYELELEVREKFPNVGFKFVMQDVVNYDRLEVLFEKYRFSMVYHAAAYKHVPLVEDNPYEGVCVNVLGSKNVALLSSRFKVNRFVMVSTDKAVNPTNVMGATKRTAELFVQSLQTLEGNTTKFITTRFGNVLGSNGSVIPHFKKQIESGGPVTVTHPEIVRYFMTIPEACELVLQAGTMGKGGEIYVFDMGQPVKIVDLARRMIKLSGLTPDTDIKIVYTGLRPGEKLYEELLSDNTKTLPTPHEKIMVSKDMPMSYEQINRLTEELIAVGQDKGKIEVVRKLKTIVPEFKSNNSVYEALD